MVIGFIIVRRHGFSVSAGLVQAFTRQTTDPSDMAQKPASFKIERLSVGGPHRPEFIRALYSLVVFAYVVYQAKFGFGAFEPRAALFPWVIGLPCLLFALYVLLQDSLQSTRKIKVEEISFMERARD